LSSFIREARNPQCHSKILGEDVAFSGGEPTLYEGLADLCGRIWSESDLGISITTHGHHLNEELISALSGTVSIIRFSIDAPEPLYSKIRSRSPSRLQDNTNKTHDHIPVGINTVVNKDTLPLLDDLAAIVANLGAINWLLVPETVGGQFSMDNAQWTRLDEWIALNYQQIPLRVATGATRFLSGPFAFVESPTIMHMYERMRLCLAVHIVAMA
jgi:MoaA/NifB/PqqE/SkfB family radical SAM enzyme